MKQTAKSCSCRQCTYAKHTTGGQKQVKFNERAFRHRMNQALRQGRDADLMPAVCGDRIG